MCHKIQKANYFLLSVCVFVCLRFFSVCVLFCLMMFCLKIQRSTTFFSLNLKNKYLWKPIHFLKIFTFFFHWATQKKKYIYIYIYKAGRPTRTYIQQICEDTGCIPEDLPEAMNDREKWRERVRDIRASGTTSWWWWYLYINFLFIYFSWTNSL